LIAIVYYLHDLPKYKRIQAKMEFCAHSCVNIIQNISMNRSNKKIGGADIRYAVSAAYLTVYPGNTMYSVLNGTQKNTYGHFPHGDFYCVKKIDGQNKILWKITFHTAWADRASNIRYERRPTPTSIVGINLNDIAANEGEIKIVLRCYSYFARESNRYLLDGRTTLSITVRQSFGFLFLNPKEFDRDGVDKGGSFFPAIVTFTPKPGLFDENPPS
jgi:hypothetical protein